MMVPLVSHGDESVTRMRFYISLSNSVGKKSIIVAIAIKLID